MKIISIIELEFMILMDVQELKFFISSPFDARNHFPLITSERYIFVINVPITSFQFLYQPAFGHLPIADQTIIADIVT